MCMCLGDSVILKMEFYGKNKDGKYWFEEIPAHNVSTQQNAISTSIMEYFNCMVNTGHVSTEMTNEYKEYIRVLRAFLDNHK